MYIAVFMGPFARGPRDDRAQIHYCIDSAIRAAEDGFSLVTFGEQHFNNYEPYCNPFLMGARLAPQMRNTWFGTSMVPIPYHNPLMLAENINILDQLMDGKLLMGFSQGRVGFSPDFENFGLDPKDQKEIFAEKFDALRAIWAHDLMDGPFTLDGKWTKGGMHGRLMPTSYRAPHPQFAIGTNTDATCEWAGENGWMISLGPCLIEEAAEKFRRFRAGLEKGGFSDAKMADCLAKSMAHHQVVVGETDEEGWAMAQTLGGMNPMLRRDLDGRTLGQMHADAVSGRTDFSEVELANNKFVESWFIAGSPETVAAKLKAHEEAGIAQVLTRFTVGAYNPEIWDRSYNLFVQEVMPQLDPQQFAAPSGDDIQGSVREGPLPPMLVPGGYGAQDPEAFRKQTAASV